MPIFEPVVILKPAMVEIHETARIDAFVKIEGGQGVQIGEHVHIASFCHINTGGGQTIIGAHSGLASHAVIVSGYPDLSYLHICPNEAPGHVHPLRRVTTIGRYVSIEVGAILCAGLTVGDGAVIKAGAVVTKHVPAWEIWAGVPARKIGVRMASEYGLAEAEHQL